MKKKETKHLGITINADLHNKFRYIAAHEGRSGNGQILYLIRKCVEAFEEKHGKIEIMHETDGDE